MIVYQSITNYFTNSIAHLAMFISLIDLIAYTTTLISLSVKIAQTSLGPLIGGQDLRALTTWTHSFCVIPIFFHLDGLSSNRLPMFPW